MHFASYSRGQFLGITFGAQYKIRLAGRRSQEGKEDRWLMLFGQAKVFAILDYSHDLDSTAILQFVVSAYCVRNRAKHIAGKLPVHDCDRWSFLIVMPRELSSCQ